MQLFEVIQHQPVPVPEEAANFKPTLMDLLRRMLTKDAFLRISLTEIKDHSWLTGKDCPVPIRTNDDIRSSINLQRNSPLVACPSPQYNNPYAPGARATPPRPPLSLLPSTLPNDYPAAPPRVPYTPPNRPLPRSPTPRTRAAPPPHPSPREALEGRGPQRWFPRRLGRRLEGVAEAVGGRLLSVTNAMEAGFWRRRQWLGMGWAPWRGEGVATC